MERPTQKRRNPPVTATKTYTVSYTYTVFLRKIYYKSISY